MQQQDSVQGAREAAKRRLLQNRRLIFCSEAAAAEEMAAAAVSVNSNTRATATDPLPPDAISCAPPGSASSGSAASAGPAVIPLCFHSTLQPSVFDLAAHEAFTQTSEDTPAPQAATTGSDSPGEVRSNPGSWTGCLCHIWIRESIRKGAHTTVTTDHCQLRTRRDLVRRGDLPHELFFTKCAIFTD